METNRSSLIGIIALIIGASGLGLGSFTVINDIITEGAQGPPGQDGVDGTDGIDGFDGIDAINGTDGTDGTDGIDGFDGIDGIDGINGTDGATGVTGPPGPPGMDGRDVPGYYCNSALEVQQALDNIGSSSGMIIINETITLTDTLYINGGGNYLIQGRNPYITIIAGGDWVVFNITDTLSCTIQNLIINSSGVGTSRSIIGINETNDNLVYIENIQILGDSGGYGVYLLSDNVAVSNCYFNNIYQFINQPTNGGNTAWIYDNKFFGSSDNGLYFLGDNNYISRNIIEDVNSVERAIYIEGFNNGIAGNKIRNAGTGIECRGGWYNTITNNILDLITDYGIRVWDSGHWNLISNNYITNTGDDGIHLSGSTENLVTDNFIMDTGLYGIYLNGGSYTVKGNRIREASYHGIFVGAGNSVISGNTVTIITVNFAWNISGIKVLDWADHCAITGNIIYSVTNSHVSGEGIGIEILSGATYCTVIGNIVQNCDFNWVNNEPTTIGDSTTNSFS